MCVFWTSCHLNFKLIWYTMLCLFSDFPLLFSLNTLHPAKICNSCIWFLENKDYTRKKEEYDHRVTSVKFRSLGVKQRFDWQSFSNAHCCGMPTNAKLDLDSSLSGKSTKLKIAKQKTIVVEIQRDARIAINSIHRAFIG